MAASSAAAVGIGALDLAAAAAAFASRLELESPAALRPLHLRAARRALRRAAVPPLPGGRRAQARAGAGRAAEEEEEEDCPGAPFLWKIVDDASGRHVGFGLGTMHLPAEVVSTERAYASIAAAVEDSCDVYGELHLEDSEVASELTECVASLPQDLATVKDIPDEALREAFEAKVRDVAFELAGGDTTIAEYSAALLLDLPLTSVIEMITATNTPEYWDQYLEGLLGVGDVSLDSHILSFGRPADDLEEVSTQCAVLHALSLTAEDLTQYFDLVSPSLWESLNGSLSDQIKTYKCGNMEALVEFWKTEVDGEAGINDLLLTQRNIDMAAKMNDILKANPDEKVLFAVGAAHWNIGDHSFELLLKDYGYSLEHVPNWDSERAEDLSDRHCGVVFDDETGFFVPAPDGMFAPIDNVTDSLGMWEALAGIVADWNDNSNMADAPENETAAAANATPNEASPTDQQSSVSALTNSTPPNKQSLPTQPTLSELGQPSNDKDTPSGLSGSNSTGQLSSQIAEDTNSTNESPAGETNIENVASEPSGSTVIGTSKMILLGYLICLLLCF